MWRRKDCAVCKADFGVHPKANKYFTRQLCVRCRVTLKKMPVQYKLELNCALSDSDNRIRKLWGVEND